MRHSRSIGLLKGFKRKTVYAYIYLFVGVGDGNKCCDGFCDSIDDVMTNLTWSAVIKQSVIPAGSSVNTRIIS